MITQIEILEDEIYALFVLREMVRKAEGLGANKGVAAICVRKVGETHGSLQFLAVKDKIERPSNGKPDDLGTNYFGVAMAKLAIMMATDMPSGTYKSVVKRGEVAYKGGVMGSYLSLYKVYVAFSGLSEDDDVKVAEVGLKAMLPEVYK